ADEPADDAADDLLADPGSGARRGVAAGVAVCLRGGLARRVAGAPRRRERALGVALPQRKRLVERRLGLGEARARRVSDRAAPCAHELIGRRDLRRGLPDGLFDLGVAALPGFLGLAGGRERGVHLVVRGVERLDDEERRALAALEVRARPVDVLARRGDRAGEAPVGIRDALRRADVVLEVGDRLAGVLLGRRERRREARDGGHEVVELPERLLGLVQVERRVA